jgi:hypothetical protein
MLLDVARVVAVETHLDRGSHDGGSDGGGGMGLADLSDIGEGSGVVVCGGVKVKVGEKVLGSSVKGFCMTLKGVLLLVGKCVGAMLVVILVCTVMCTVIEVVEAGGMSPRIGLGVECWLGVGAFKREGSVDEGVSSNGLGGELVENLVIATI